MKKTLEKLVLTDLRRVLAEVKTHEKEFVEKYRKCSTKEMSKIQALSRTKLVKVENRVTEINNVIAKLYEDNVLGKISEERFDLLAKKYETEKTELKAQISELKDALSVVADEEKNIQEFLKVVKSYTEIEELTLEILNSFIDRIYINDRTIVNGVRRQEIKIVYKFIGAESTHGYKVKGSRVAEIF